MLMPDFPIGEGGLSLGLCGLSLVEQIPFNTSPLVVENHRLGVLVTVLLLLVLLSWSTIPLAIAMGLGIVIVGEAVVEEIKGLIAQFVIAGVFHDVFPAAGSLEIDGQNITNPRRRTVGHHHESVGEE